MFSMAVPGLANSLIAITVSLHPAAAPHALGYAAQPGDTLSAIAARAYGSAADWPAVWWANRRQLPDPDLIAAGQRLELPGRPQVPALLARAALATAAAPATRARPPPTRRRRRSRQTRQPPRRPRPRALPARRWQAGLTGQPLRPASRAATGRSTPATASTAACSSPSRPGSATAAASTPPRPTWPPRPSRSPWPRRSWRARASAPGPYAGQEANPPPRRHLPVPGSPQRAGR